MDQQIDPVALIVVKAWTMIGIEVEVEIRQRIR